ADLPARPLHVLRQPVGVAPTENGVGDESLHLAGDRPVLVLRDGDVGAEQAEREVDEQGQHVDQPCFDAATRRAFELARADLHQAGDPPDELRGRSGRALWSNAELLPQAGDFVLELADPNGGGTRFDVADDVIRWYEGSQRMQ